MAGVVSFALEQAHGSVPPVDVHPNQITQWKSQLQEGAAGVFGSEARSDPAASRVDIQSLHAKIGALTLENDFLESALGKAGLLSAKR